MEKHYVFFSDSVCILEGNSLAELDDFLMQISLSAVDEIITQQPFTAAPTVFAGRVIFSFFDFELVPLTCLR